MYAQVEDFCVSRGSPTVPLTQISCNAVFFKSQNPRKAGTLCNRKRRTPHVLQKRYHSILYLWFVERFWMHRAKEGLYLHLQKNGIVLVWSRDVGLFFSRMGKWAFAYTVFSLQQVKENYLTLISMLVFTVFTTKFWVLPTPLFVVNLHKRTLDPVRNG